jgi:hypothetical protein
MHRAFWLICMALLLAQCASNREPIGSTLPAFQLGVSFDSAIRFARSQGWILDSTKWINGYSRFANFSDIRFGNVDNPFYAKLLFDNDSLISFEARERPPVASVSNSTSASKLLLTTRDYYRVVTAMKLVLGVPTDSGRSITGMTTMPHYDASLPPIDTVCFTEWVENLAKRRRIYRVSYTTYYPGILYFKGDIEGNRAK